jgi:N-methylhydantoinase A
MHAAAVARQLGIRRVLVPAHPGVLCALGLVVSDIKTEFSRTRITRLDRTTPRELDAAFTELEDDARGWAERSGFRAADVTLTRGADVRHARQNHELGVPVARKLGRDGVARVEREFHAAHERAYGCAAPAEPVEVVTFRVTATVPVEAPALPPAARTASTVAGAKRGTRRVWFERGGFAACPVYGREQLPRSATLRGPAILEQVDATTVLAPGDVATIDRSGNVLITVRPS